MANVQFGSGVLYGNPVLGNQPVNPSPYRFQVLQEVNVDFKGDLKKLFGQKQFPVATARGKVEVMIKGKLAVFDVSMFNQIFLAQTQTTGVNVQVDQEQQTISSNAATVANVPIVEDWGVQYSNGQQFQLVNTNPAFVPVNTGQYAGPNLATGKYSFNNGDNGQLVKISYQYSNSSRGVTITLANQLMGYAPELKMVLYNNFRNKYFAIELNDVTLGGIAIPTKLEDFWVADFDGSANADVNDNLGKLMADLV